jgi:hypothetical protein
MEQPLDRAQSHVIQDAGCANEPYTLGALRELRLRASSRTNSCTWHGEHGERRTGSTSASA